MDELIIPIKAMVSHIKQRSNRFDYQFHNNVIFWGEQEMQEVLVSKFTPVVSNAKMINM